MKRAIHFTLGCLIAAALPHGTIHAQGGRAALEQQMFNQRTQVFNYNANAFNSQIRAYNSLTNGRNPFLNFNNQMQLGQLQMQQGGLYTGNFGSQALMNGLAARTYGTNFGIPFNYGQVGNYYTPPYAFGGYGAGIANPYAYGGYGYGAGIANPYAPTAAGYGVGAAANQYSPNGGDPNNPYSPYSPYNNPYNSPGGTLMGSADVMKAYGSVINAQEDARIKREQALQAQLETKKKKFDLDMYIKANTPTYTQEQEVVARNTLRRIQTNSLAGEVQNGKSLNYLLNDLGKYPNKKTVLEPLPLSEAALSHVNVAKGTVGLGLLRDDGRITWPPALQTFLTVNQRKDLEEQIKGLVKDAYKGKLDANVLKDVRNEMGRIREDLLKKVNDIPLNQYMDAKRFLQEFDQSSVALERGEAPAQAKFQRFVEGGRSVQEVADYMIKEGLRFGPASADDEAAYRAVHTAMAAYDIAMNAQYGADNKDQ